MTKRERKLFEAGVNPLTGKPMGGAPTGSPRIAPPARATVAPAWYLEAAAAQAAAAAVPVAPVADRVWTYTSRGVSGSGRDTIVLSAPMRNGGSFRATFPGDAIRAIAEGRVVGLSTTAAPDSPLAQLLS